MHRGTRSLPLALGVVLLALGLWWVVGRRGPRSAPELGGTAGAPEVPRDADTAPDPLLSPTPEPPPTEPGARESAVRGALAAEEAWLRGAVVDSKARPVPGAVVVASRRGAVGLEHVLGPANRGRDVEAGRAETGAEGAFSLAVAAGRPHDLRATAPGYAPTILPGVHAGESPTIVLRRGATVTGRITRTEDGVPVAGARVLVLHAGVSEPVWEGVTDEDGSYRAEGLDPGRNDLEVDPIEECRERTTLDLEEGGTALRDLRVSLGVIVTGRVTAADSGDPVEGAEIGSETFPSKLTRSDATGHYVLAGLPLLRTLEVPARAQGFGRQEVVLGRVEDRLLEVDFALVRGRSATGRVVGEDGGPVEGATVAALARSFEENHLQTDRVVVRTDRDGRFELTGIRRDLPHSLLVQRDGLSPIVVRAFDAGDEDRIELGELRLPRGGRLSGRALTIDGRGIPDVWVDLASLDPGQSDPSLGLGRMSLRTDAEGRFHFCDVPPGRHVLRAVVTGFEQEARADIEIGEGQAVQDYELVVGAVRMIAGRVLDPDGLGVEGANVVLRRTGEATGPATSSGREGRFRFTGVQDGTYEIDASFQGTYDSSGDLYELAGETVVGVTVGTDDVAIHLRRASVVTGQVVDQAGNPVLQARVVAIDGRGARAAGQNVDTEGRFRLVLPEDATVELRVWRTTVDPVSGRSGWADEQSGPQAVQSPVRAGELEIQLVVP